MPLLPAHWGPLAGPPSLASCSRDIFSPGLRLEPEAALRMARDIAAAVAHLHRRGILHGDLYAHNTLWDGAAGEAVLSDFGAACALPAGREGDAGGGSKCAPGACCLANCSIFPRGSRSMPPDGGRFNAPVCNRRRALAR